MSRNFDVLRRLELEERVPRNRTSSSAAAAPSMAVADVPRPEVAEDARCPITDEHTSAEMKKLVERLFMGGGREAPHVVVFAPVEQTSAANGICAQAAAMLARQSGKSVCVVDANIASPSLHRCFNVANDAGISDCLLSGRSVRGSRHKVPDLDLTIVTAGSRTADWETMISSGAMTDKMRELRQQFEYLLIEGSPLTSASTALLHGRLADGVLMIVEANSTRRELVRKVKADLDALEIPVLGTVLNNRDFPIPEYLYRKL